MSRDVFVAVVVLAVLSLLIEYIGLGIKKGGQS